MAATTSLIWRGKTVATERYGIPFLVAVAIEEYESLSANGKKHLVSTTGSRSTNTVDKLITESTIPANHRGTRIDGKPFRLGKSDLAAI